MAMSSVACHPKPAGAKGGGEGGIRTPDTVARMPHFECGAFNHSATSPEASRHGSSVVGLYLAAAALGDKAAVSGDAVPGGVAARRYSSRPSLRSSE
jgi:hypothetical protein